MKDREQERRIKKGREKYRKRRGKKNRM
jgi:hypothetical protein